MKPTKNIILIHGWGGSKKSLASLAQALADKGYTTHLLELPGHGATPQMSKPWQMSDFTNWLENYLQKRNIKEYALVGHSFGGRIIIDSLVNQALKPQKIVLIDASGVKPKNAFKKIIWKNLSRVSKIVSLPEFLRRFIYKYIIGERDYINIDGNLKETFKNINEEFYNTILEKIDVPTLLIWGRDDKLTPLWMGKYLKQHIPHSKLKVLEGSHSLPLKSPLEVANLIIDFTK